MTKVEIQIDGGAGFHCESGQNLLREALREGLGFPYECNSGGCGSCQFELLEGKVTDLWEAAPGLSSRARTIGRRLACQSEVAGDCRIKVRLKPEFVPIKAALLQSAQLVERRVLTQDMTEYSFECEGEADFLPGQYALLHLPGVVGARAYSMSNQPNVQGRWSFIIKRLPGGRGTAILTEKLCIGERVPLDGPYGLAYLRSDVPRDIVCIGGGSGLSPLKSILSAAVREPALIQQFLYLFYGGRTPADMCTDQILDEDPQLRQRVKVISAISDISSTATWNGERGFIHDVVRRWLDDVGGAQNREYYFCGPPQMTEAVQRLLVFDYKVPTAQLHFDRFL